MLHFANQKSTTARNKHGVSLMYVLVVGGITASAAIALGSSLFPIYNHVSSLARRDEVIDVAENSLRYALAKYALFAKNHEELQTVTADKLVPPDAMKNNATVSLDLTDANTNTLKSNGVYVSSDYTYPTIGEITPAFKFLTIVASKGNYTHRIRILLKPDYGNFPNYVSPDGTGSGGTSSPPPQMFAGALQANTSLRIADGIDVSMEDGSKLGANIGSNNLITLDGNTTVNGNINAYSPGGTTTPTSIKATTNAKVMGNVSASGNVVNVDSSITTSPLTSDATGGNVYGDGVNGPTPTAGTVNNSAAISQSAPITTPSPTQEAQITGTFSNPSSISMGGNGTSSNPVADLGSLTVQSGQTVTLSPGNYVVNNLTVESGGTLTIKSSPSDSSTGVNLYVQGNGDVTTPIDIQGNVNFSGITPSPNNFQMFYNGQKSLNISMANSSNLYSLLYAPNSSIGLNLGANSNFHGAISGDTVLVQKNSNVPPGSKANFIYDSNATNLSPPSSSGAAPAPQTTLPVASSNGGYAVKNYKVLYWQEPLN